MPLQFKFNITIARLTLVAVVFYCFGIMQTYWMFSPDLFGNKQSIQNKNKINAFAPPFPLIHSNKFKSNHDHSSSYNGLFNGIASGLNDNIYRRNVSRIINCKRKIRLLFVVGIEGTGHHVWKLITEGMLKYSNNIRLGLHHELLDKCLLSCFENVWPDSFPRMNPEIKNQCECFKQELMKFILNEELIPNDSLLHVGVVLSYPFFANMLSRMPDLSKLIELVTSDDLLPYTFDVRLIVMKRDWVKCLVSSCVKRFGECPERITYSQNALSIIQTQLLGIDASYWIMIDFEDLTERPLEYKHIFSQWLSLPLDVIEYGLKEIKKSSNRGWDDINDEKLRNDIQNAFYSKHAISKWPIWNSKYFLVTPQNTKFLDEKKKLFLDTVNHDI